MCRKKSTYDAMLEASINLFFRLALNTSSFFLSYTTLLPSLTSPHHPTHKGNVKPPKTALFLKKRGGDATRKAAFGMRVVIWVVDVVTK